MISLDSLIDNLPRTAKSTVNRFKSISIYTCLDLLTYIPTRYEDYRLFIPISDIQRTLADIHKRDSFNKLTQITTKGIVTDFTNLYTRRRLQIQKAIMQNNGAQIQLVWYNQPYLRTLLIPGTKLQVSGTFELFGNTAELKVDEFDILREETQAIHTGRLVPIYSEKRGLTSHLLREKIRFILNTVTDKIPEILPDSILKKNSLISRHSAFEYIHFPSTNVQADQAHTRLAFEELFVIQLSSQLVKQEWHREKIRKPFLIESYMKKISSFVINLPFKLTHAQEVVIKQILSDLKQSYPMNRLVQGDVGSGKTVVAAVAAYAAHLNGYQVLFMAPTEVLAQQHYATLKKMFSLLKGSDICFSLITSSSTRKKGEIDNSHIIVGTHSLIAKKANFENIGLVIVDEQHKFGVAQRAQLKQKGIHPHLLSMTATPIPRTVALTLYGELDLSVIDEMPKGRRQTKTFVVSQKKRDKAYKWIKQLIRSGSVQMFIICPLIEESKKESMSQVKAVVAEYDRLSSDIFTNFKLGLLHGRMKAIEKQNVMTRFANKKLDILVSTSVVEVGVDIPNASIIVIEGAERFGLAQLHQLRGRVGRSDKQAYCLVFTDKQDPWIIKRLQFFAQTASGFALAEYDLHHRGSGEIYGIKQHGESELKIASLAQTRLLHQSYREAVSFVKDYDPKNYPALASALTAYSTKNIARD